MRDSSPSLIRGTPKSPFPLPFDFAYVAASTSVLRLPCITLVRELITVKAPFCRVQAVRQLPPQDRAASRAARYGPLRHNGQEPRPRVCRGERHHWLREVLVRGDEVRRHGFEGGDVFQGLQ